MAAKLFRHLFYGSDSRKSLQELMRWTALYEAKHGSAAKYVIDGNEADLQQTRQKMQQYLQGASLFAEPQLVIIKRLSLPRKLVAAQTKALEQLVGDLEHIPEGMTILIWEEYDLPPTHPILRGFEHFQATATGKGHRFTIPDERSLGAAVQTVLSPYGLELSVDALHWLKEQYRILGLLQIPGRGKPAMAEERGWWLANLLEGAALRAQTSQIDLTALRAEQNEQLAPASPFAFTKAVAAGDFNEAHRQAGLFMQVADESAYFGLWGALQWQLDQPGVRLPCAVLVHAKRLLGEIEINAKRGELLPAWLLHQYLVRLATSSNRSLIEPRILWLSSLPIT